MTRRQPMFEFHISREARDRYRFDASLFSLTGNVILGDFYSARVLAQKMNVRRDLARFPEQAVKAGAINAMGLIDEILHLMVGLYREQKSPQAMERALAWLDEHLSPADVDAALGRFADEFPPLAVYRGEMALPDYVRGETDGVPNRQILLEEMLMLWLANANPAFGPYIELFDDATLEKETSYRQILSGLHDYFDTQPVFGPDQQNVIDMLRAPAIASPHSLPGQLEYIMERWGHLLGKHLYRLLRSRDLIREEEKASFLGPGPARVYDFAGLESEAERFSRDSDWMPNVVLIAKNSYVWLDQLSKKYRRSITRLDQIPDEELDTLSHWGFTGLWLIGLWERSRASQRIKQLCGNPDAVASAYSLFDYQVAADLGGDEAYRNLRDRAWQRGIRLASDMVPNHVGIDSRWVIEHPDWFIGQDTSPFPAYTFGGPDLSWDERVGIYLEDHYYSRSDAAVVFRRQDRWTGSERFIYHGNDGTSMPWNDTAQLDYLKAEVREAVIDKILQVARMFPIIRFDAAMTLAKKHYQRLWFPEPGTGGDIPSRSEHGLTRKDFDALMPAEFWREVVDRVAREAPDTLLLAEAFWLMEGYFVRTLGMHRVYNSAFMNMLRDEKNAEYRAVIKNTLEFDPRILQRYVNFMNNPDERTAVDQFGKDDKYMGICTLLATLPGLPMFGHGQVEGLTEKYGMEYRRAYWDEWPDRGLIERHEREVFPLLRRRYLFTSAVNFYLYDLFTPEGGVNEDVFAYSNRAGDECALVIYHNRFAEARGWIRTSVAYSVPTEGEGHQLVQKSLGEGLGLHNDDRAFCLFRDHVTGLEYIRPSTELLGQGLYVELGAYKRHVFLGFHEVWDDEWRQYSHLTANLSGRGVPSIQDAIQELLLRPVREPFAELVNARTFRRLVNARTRVAGELIDPSLMQQVEDKAVRLLQAAKQIAGGTGDERSVAHTIRNVLVALLQAPALADYPPLPEPTLCQSAIERVPAMLGDSWPAWGTALGWAFVHALGRIADHEERGGHEEHGGQEERGGEYGADAAHGADAERGADAEVGPQLSRSWLDDWSLASIIVAALRDLGVDEAAAAQCVATIRVLTTHQRWFEVQGTLAERAYRALTALLRDSEVQQLLNVNRYQGVLWYRGESFDALLDWLFLVAVVESTASQRPPDQVRQEIVERCAVIVWLQDAGRRSGYQVERLLEAAR